MEDRDLTSMISDRDMNGKIRILDKKRAVKWIMQYIEEGVIFERDDKDKWEIGMWEAIAKETGTYWGEIKEIYNYLRNIEA